MRSATIAQRQLCCGNLFEKGLACIGMKVLKVTTKLALIRYEIMGPKLARVYPKQTPHPYLIDKRFLYAVVTKRWTYVRKWGFSRGSVNKRRTFLHKFILRLGRKDWPAVTFVDGDKFNCTLVNLKPYDKELDGATRRLFKNNKSGRKGVYYRKDRKKWQAVIKTKSCMRHLGYFKTPDSAAKAYVDAYVAIYNKKP